jgi:hypothetical protein
MGMWKNARAGAAFTREYQQAAMETLSKITAAIAAAWAICRYLCGRSAEQLLGVLPIR